VSRNQRFDPSINYYAVLDVSLDASREEITRTYRALMRLTHPDNFSEPVARQKAEERAKLINAAYTVLSRPEIRKEYDQIMRRQLMTDVVMQRYTAGAPGRPTQVERPRRKPSAQSVRAQREAYKSAVWQLVLTTAAVAFGLIVVIIMSVLLFNGLRTVF
jgi:curved DNA-binding protein CbpA